MQALLKLFRREPTVETITAPITKIVTKLQTHADRHNGLVEHHKTQVEKHVGHADAANKEAMKALTTAQKFAGLVS